MARPPFQLRVLATDDVYFDGAAKSVVFPGLDGLVGVLPGHAPMIAAIGAGPLKIVPADGPERFLFVADGFARVADGVVSIVCNATSRPGEIDLARAERAAERARERMRLSASDAHIDLLRAEAALRRALQRERFAQQFS